MKIDYDSLRRFEKTHDAKVEMFGAHGKAVMLKDGTVDKHGTIETAATFTVNGKSYSRAEFETLLDTLQ